MNKRIYQYEVIRIVAMFMIVLHHVCMHGNFQEGISVYNFDTNGFYIQSLAVFGKVGVFLFVMITGYFLSESHPKMKKMLPLLGQVTFYLGIGCLFLVKDAQQSGILSWYELKKMFVSAFYPYTGYWFINAYVFLYILAPYINLGLKIIKKKAFLKLLVTMVVVLSLSGLVTGTDRPLGDVGILLLPYLFGAFFKKYPLDIKVGKLWGILGGTLALMYLSIIFYDIFGLKWHMETRIGSPMYAARDAGILVIILSVTFFLLLQKIQIKSIWIQREMGQIGKCMLGVYLLHDNRIIRPRLAAHIAPFLNVKGIKIIVPIIVAAIIVFVGSTAFEKARQIIVHGIQKIVADLTASNKKKHNTRRVKSN